MKKKQAPKPKPKVSKVKKTVTGKPKIKTEPKEKPVVCIPKKVFYLMAIGGFLIGFGFSIALRRR